MVPDEFMPGVVGYRLQNYLLQKWRKVKRDERGEGGTTNLLPLNGGANTSHALFRLPTAERLLFFSDAVDGKSSLPYVPGKGAYNAALHVFWANFFGLPNWGGQEIDRFLPPAFRGDAVLHKHAVVFPEHPSYLAEVRGYATPISFEEDNPVPQGVSVQLWSGEDLKEKTPIEQYLTDRYHLMERHLERVGLLALRIFLRAVPASPYGLTGPIGTFDSTDYVEVDEARIEQERGCRLPLIGPTYFEWWAEEGDAIESMHGVCGRDNTSMRTAQARFASVFQKITGLTLEAYQFEHMKIGGVD